VVLTSYRNRTNYALIAGFCEVGESPEDTVRREVMEEVGLKVKNLRYYKSQPWSFSETLLMGFVAELDGDDTIHRDENELGFAAWVNRHDIADNVFHRSLTAEMILAFRDGLI